MTKSFQKNLTLWTLKAQLKRTRPASIKNLRAKVEVERECTSAILMIRVTDMDAAFAQTLANTFDVTLSDFGITLSRLFGSALFGFSVLLWFGRQSTQPDTHKATLACMFSYFLLSTVFYLIAQLSGLMNVMGWSAVGLHLILLIAFGYFLLKRTWNERIDPENI